MTSLTVGYTLYSARGLDALPVRVLHDIGRLRQEVFVVEQDCPYLDFDGRDAEPKTIQYWVADTAGTIVATIRVLDETSREQGLHAIGRVATAAGHRGKGLAASLMQAAVVDHGHQPLILEAQSHLTGWYGRFGFAAAGAEYLEDGIPHTPMRRLPHAVPTPKDA